MSKSRGIKYMMDTTKNILAFVGAGGIAVLMANPAMGIWARYRQASNTEGEVERLGTMVRMVRQRYRSFNDGDVLLDEERDPDVFQRYLHQHRGEFERKEQARQQFMGRFIAETGLIPPPSGFSRPPDAQPTSVFSRSWEERRRASGAGGGGGGGGGDEGAPAPLPSEADNHEDSDAPWMEPGCEYWAPGATVLSRPGDDATKGEGLVAVDVMYRRYQPVTGDVDADGHWVPVRVRAMPLSRTGDDKAALVDFTAGLPHGLSYKRFGELE